jgi:deoxyribodipyrimidine photolyase-related protein
MAALRHLVVVLGMSQYADSGFLASKPYVASGRYIQGMSNYCAGCRYRPEQALGADACPFTTRYWDFLDRHRRRFASHPRTALMWRNLQRFDDLAMGEVRNRAEWLRQAYGDHRG